MTTVEALRKARALIKKGWCQGFFAQTSDGEEVDANDRRARKWCASGAVFAQKGHGRIVGDALSVLSRVVETSSISDWNDAPVRTKREVLAAFDRAIKAASK